MYAALSIGFGPIHEGNKGGPPAGFTAGFAQVPGVGVGVGVGMGAPEQVSVGVTERLIAPFTTVEITVTLETAQVELTACGIASLT